MRRSVREQGVLAGGFTSGFDYMRIILALGVMAIHGFVLTYPDLRISLWTSWTRVFAAAVLPMFFALSGFLVTGSFLKSRSLATFLTHRALRLVPALAVEVLLSALVLGPIVTTVALSDYAASPVFWRYFGNIVGWIHFELPGVFTAATNHGQPGIVNRSLWTVPFELECYLALVALAVFGVVRRRTLFLAVTILAATWGSWTVIREAGWALTVPATPVDGRALVVAFLVGCCGKLFEERIIMRWAWLIAALAFSAVTLRYYQTQYLALFPVAYVTVFLGMLNPPRNRIILSGDYSYGLYLFAFPIQQTYFYFLPDNHNYAGHMAASIACAILYACFSWWLIEKPILSRRREATAWVEGMLRPIRRRTAEPAFRPAA